MSGKILIAFDKSEDANKAVLFVTDHFTRDHQVTLFHVVPNTAAVCELNSPSLTPHFNSQRSSFCEMENVLKEEAREGMQRLKSNLVDAGFSAEKIVLTIRTQNKSVASDIVREANEGYDAIVMGRRGASGIREFFLGSVSQKVLHAAKDKAVVIVE